MASTSVTLDTLQQTIARALSRFPHERARIERAALLVALGHVEQISATVWTVKSQTRPGSTYSVAGGTYADKAHGCTCVDAQRHPGQSCKHAWAVDLVQVAEERQRRQDAERQRVLAEAVASADRVAIAYARSIGWAA